MKVEIHRTQDIHPEYKQHFIKLIPEDKAEIELLNMRRLKLTEKELDSIHSHIYTKFENYYCSVDFIDMKANNLFEVGVEVRLENNSWANFLQVETKSF